MKNAPFIKGKRITLVCLTKESTPVFHQWLNDLDTLVPFEEEPLPSNPSEIEEFITNCYKDKRHLIFGIRTNRGAKIIGLAGLRNIEYLNRKADLMVCICEKKLRGRGLGTESVLLVLEYAFRKLNLHSVMLYVYDFNRKAIKCYRKCGFKTIGIRRQAKLIDNKFHDAIYMDILAEEFLKRK
jgi:RimJ/RimL family protein N-acetyltransferase